MTELMDLPDDVLNIVVDHFTRIEKDIRVFVSLACTSSFFYNLLNKEEQFEKLLKNQSNKNINYSDKKLLYKHIIRLYYYTGCEFCKIKGVIKVYVEFGVRCCINCLYERTINEYYLVNDYFVSEDILNQNRCREIDSYHYKFGAHTSKYFWKADFEKYLHKKL